MTKTSIMVSAMTKLKLEVASNHLLLLLTKIRIMKRDEERAYRERLENMSRGQLVGENVKLKKRLDKLSDICDVEDTYRAMIEQGQAERKVEKLEKELSCVSEIIKNELIRRKVRFEPWFSSTQLTNLLIDSINQ